LISFFFFFFWVLASSRGVWFLSSVHHDECRFREAGRDFKKVLELKPRHSNGQKELEKSSHASALLDQATALFDAEEIDQAAGALEKVLEVSSECAPVHFRTLKQKSNRGVGDREVRTFRI